MMSHAGFKWRFVANNFYDPDGFRTAAQLQPVFPPGLFFSNNEIWEITATSTFQIYDGNQSTN